MHKKLVAVVSTAAVIAGLALTGSAAHAVTATSIAGKGSSFANNALQYCLSHYDPASNDTVSYTSTGSGTGRSEMAAGNVKWAASDGLYGASDAQPASYTMVPILGGPVVFAYNASSGIPAGLKLDAATVSGILKGDIKTWNAYAIKKLNPGKTLPAKAIQVFYRTSGSGTTANLTTYLSQTLGSSQWVSGSKDLLDASDGVSGNSAGKLASTALAKTTSAIIADKLQATKYSFGYFDLSDAVSAKVGQVALKNAAGQYQLPTAAAAAKFLNAQTAIVDAASQRTDGTLTIDFTKKVAGAYQLSIVSYGIAPRGTNTEAGRAVHDWFTYLVNSCMPAKGASLGYVPLTGSLKTTALQQIAKIN
jgi:phosphate transport system substrate-binding protein